MAKTEIDDTQIKPGSGNQLLGVNSAATADEYKTLSGTTNQIIKTDGVGTITLSTPQDIATSSSPTFGGLTLSGNEEIQSGHALQLDGSTSGNIQLKAADTTTSYSVKWPSAQASGTQVLQNDGSGNLSWATSPTTPVTVTNGGTGDTTLTAHAVLLGEGTSAVAFAGPGTTNFALVSNGTSSDPSFQAIVNSLSATSNQTTVSASTGAVTIGTVQNIGTGSSPTFASETLTNTTNQLVLGTTHTTTISSTAPSASRTYTIPDAGSAANVVLDQGNYTIGGTWTFSNAITITPTTNQLVLGTTRTTTISATQPATSSRTVTIPDPGANDTFDLLGLSQTISGVKTFSGGSGAITMSSSTIAMGSNKITGLANGTASSDAAAFGQIKLLQRVTATGTTSTTTTSSSFVSTVITANITPTSSSNKVKMTASFIFHNTGDGQLAGVSFMNGSTELTGQAFGIGYFRITTSGGTVTGIDQVCTITWIDSPASTSSQTYSVCIVSPFNQNVAVGSNGVAKWTITLEEVV